MTRKRLIYGGWLWLAWLLLPLTSVISQTPSPKPSPLPTLGLENGTREFTTPNFKLKLVNTSQTLAALQPNGANGFDFTPADRLAQRASDGFYQFGDITLRVRDSATGKWQDISTATHRQAITALPVSGSVLAAADLKNTLPADFPLTITRTWLLENGQLVLRFELRNKTAAPVQIGALGIPLVFNNLITGRRLADSHENCSFSDPYIGQDAGYVQVTRLNGHGPALVVVPDGKTPLEAYQLLNEPMRPSQTFEGTFAWLAHSLAYAENEWRNATPWNPPTSATLAPNETRTYGLRFLLSDQIRNIEATLAAQQRPVAVGFPGYVLPQDVVGRLFLKYPQSVVSIEIEPKNALIISPGKPTPNGWQAYNIRGNGWGRARLTVVYTDGARQAISYYVIKPAAQAVADMGRFLTTKQWFADAQDPFGRGPAVMSYDREADKIVTQDSRAWIAGLGDEGGSGSWLAAAMKVFGQPEKVEVGKFAEFVDETLWGGLQYSSGPNQYGVRKSLFYYEPAALPDFPYEKSFNWGTWTSWKKAHAESVERGYNYPHVVAAYWSLYRLARNHPGLISRRKWEWYLEQAYQTVRFLTERNEKGEYKVGYVDTGLMEGDIFLMLLQDLQREGWAAPAGDLEKRMKQRADAWRMEAYPFGSEMAWDSTGQEEIYAWTHYFGYDNKAQEALDTIIGYMPGVPHWGYNGNARRYWDFLYGGKLRRIERQLHHYGSGINAIPVLAHYRRHPDDDYLLRIGYGGTLGALTNIDREGFASAAFHSYPDTLKWDAYSGDYGPNFFGHAVNTATYLIKHPEFGWQAFGGNVKTAGSWVAVKPLDSFRMRFYLAPLGLWLTLDAGAFESVEVNPRTHAVRVALSPATPDTPAALLRIEQPASIAGVGKYQPRQQFKQERGGFIIPLNKKTTWLELYKRL